MTKTIVLGDDIHRNLKKVQAVLYEKYDIEMHMQDILSYIVRKSGVERHDIIAKCIHEEIIGNKGIETMARPAVEKSANIVNMPLVQMT